MPQWRRAEESDAIALAAEVPDAIAVYDDKGNLIGWDDSAANRFLREHGLPGLEPT